MFLHSLVRSDNSTINNILHKCLCSPYFLFKMRYFWSCFKRIICTWSYLFVNYCLTLFLRRSGKVVWLIFWTTLFIPLSSFLLNQFVSILNTFHGSSHSKFVLFQKFCLVCVISIFHWVVSHFLILKFATQSVFTFRNSWIFLKSRRWSILFLWCCLWSLSNKITIWELSYYFLRFWLLIRLVVWVRPVIWWLLSVVVIVLLKVASVLIIICSIIRSFPSILWIASVGILIVVSILLKLRSVVSILRLPTSPSIVLLGRIIGSVVAVRHLCNLTLNK